jgi:hypothetical protein
MAAMPDAQVIDLYRRHLKNWREAIRGRDSLLAWDEENAWRMYAAEARRRGIEAQLKEAV